MLTRILHVVLGKILCGQIRRILTAKNTNRVPVVAKVNNVHYFSRNLKSGIAILFFARV
jgi:hypothetical protein